MSMILYHGEPNGPSLSVLAVLAESEVKAECRRINLLAGERHTLSGVSEPVARDMAVEAEGPVLFSDGEAMTESVFIGQFLDELGSGHLQPKDAHAHWQMLMWCRRVTERCAPAAAFLGCKMSAHPALAALDPETFSAISNSIASEDLRLRWAAVRAGNFPSDEVADSIRHVTATVDLVEDQLADGRDWLMSDLTIADFETYGWLAGMVNIVPDAFAGKARSGAWLERVRARPSVQWALGQASVSDPLANWAPGPEINRWG
jgi:GSH-dependent disulfide-bond oxidoreductase